MCSRVSSQWRRLGSNSKTYSRRSTVPTKASETIRGSVWRTSESGTLLSTHRLREMRISEILLCLCGIWRPKKISILLLVAFRMLKLLKKELVHAKCTDTISTGLLLVKIQSFHTLSPQITLRKNRNQLQAVQT
jgi:hypothetical protein